MVARWIERRFERLIWKFRLISIVPVVLSRWLLRHWSD